jgi:hypothetical protein
VAAIGNFKERAEGSMTVVGYCHPQWPCYQGGAMYPDHDPGRDSTHAKDIGPWDKANLTGRTDNLPGVNLGAVEPIRNG